MTTHIESITAHDDPRFSVITVRTRPGRVARLCGQKDTVRSYVGAGTAWYDEEHKPVAGPIRYELAEAWTGALVIGALTAEAPMHRRPERHSERPERPSASYEDRTSYEDRQHGDGQQGSEPIITLESAA